MLRSPSNIMTLYNVSKTYKDKEIIMIFKKPRDIVEKGWELLSYEEELELYFDRLEKISDKNSKERLNTLDDIQLVDELHNPDSLAKSIRRTKVMISDYIMHNQFQVFATFTFANVEIRKEFLKATSKFNEWLKSVKRKYGQFKYLAVPEKDKNDNWHFHVLMDVNCLPYSRKVTEKGRELTRWGRKIYQLDCYDIGFNDFTFIDNADKVSSYVKKYITKDLCIVKGKKRYWTSRDLELPFKRLNVDYDIKDFNVLLETEHYLKIVRSI